MPRLPFLLVFAVLSVPGVAAAATVQADSASRSVACGGEDAVVEGSRNDITFTGSCRSLAVRGDGNAITVELIPGAALDIQGNGNRVGYSVGGLPAVQVAGSGTDVQRIGDAPASATPIALTGDGMVLDLDCAGRDVVIRGNGSQYILRGGCRSVIANGNGNHIHAELQAGARVVAEGNDTRFVYSVPGGGEAVVGVRGERSRAEREGATTQAATDADVPMPPTVPPKSQPSPMIPSPADDAVASGPAETPLIVAGTSRLPALLRLLDARVVADGTQVAVASDEMFQPGSDALRRGADTKLKQIVQLAGMIRPSATRLAIADPADTDLATRRAEALGAWFAANGLAVRQADVLTGAAAGAVGVLLAR